ncbi:glycosyltransferase family 9 protein [Verrucomicrobiota bacterium]
MKILIIKLSALGDLFHALPAVHNLKVGLNAEIDWVTQKEYADVVNCFTDVDRVIPFFRNSFFTNFKPFLHEIRAGKYDYVIDMQGLLKSAVVALLAKGGQKIGPSFQREGSRLFYSAVAGKRDKNRHAVEENLDIIRYLGLDPVKIEFPVNFPEKELAEKQPRVAILPASRWDTKNWPVKCFIDTAERLKTAGNISLFLLGGPGDTGICREIEDGLNGEVINMAGKTSLVEMGSLLKEMDLLIANDSGPVHMAAAVGTSALVIFGPTDPVRTGPYGKAHRIARASLSCQPCFSRTCRKGDIPCLTGITPEEVADMAVEMLGSRA